MRCTKCKGMIGDYGLGSCFCEETSNELEDFLSGKLSIDDIVAGPPFMTIPYTRIFMHEQDWKLLLEYSREIENAAE